MFGDTTVHICFAVLAAHGLVLLRTHDRLPQRFCDRSRRSRRKSGVVHSILNGLDEIRFVFFNNFFRFLIRNLCLIFFQTFLISNSIDVSLYLFQLRIPKNGSVVLAEITLARRDHLKIAGVITNNASDKGVFILARLCSKFIFDIFYQHQSRIVNDRLRFGRDGRLNTIKQFKLFYIFIPSGRIFNKLTFLFFGVQLFQSIAELLLDIRSGHRWRQARAFKVFENAQVVNGALLHVLQEQLRHTGMFLLYLLYPRIKKQEKFFFGRDQIFFGPLVNTGARKGVKHLKIRNLVTSGFFHIPRQQFFVVFRKRFVLALEPFQSVFFGMADGILRLFGNFRLNAF